MAVHYNNKRTLVGDTDTGYSTEGKIGELIQLWRYTEKVLLKRKIGKERNTEEVS